MKTLLDECLEALKNNVILVSQEESELLYDKITSKLPFMVSGHISWSDVIHKIPGITFEEIMKITDTYEQNVFVLWDDAEIPAIKADIMDILDVFDDVVAVGFYTWIFPASLDYIIEVGSDVWIGFPEKQKITP